MKRRILALSLAAILIASSCTSEPETPIEDYAAQTEGISSHETKETTTSVVTETTTQAVSVTTTATAVTTPVSTETETVSATEAVTTAKAADEAVTTAETTTTAVTTTAETTTAAQIASFEAVHLPRTAEVGYGDFLGYREIFDSVEQSENPRGSAQYINIDDVIYSYTGDIPKEKSGSSVTEYLSHNEKFISAFEGEPSYEELYSLELIGTGISTLDVFSLENLSATKEHSPYFRLSEDFVISIDDYYKKTEWESCSFSVWQRNESMTNMCRTAKLLWKVREQYEIAEVNKIWLAYTDEPYYLEINAPEKYHETITKYLSANNVKSGYKFKTAYHPQLKFLSQYDDRIIREDYAKYISTPENQYSPTDVYILSYCGSYNGNEVVIMDLCTSSMYDYYSTYLVGDYWLDAPGDCQILLHRNGSFLTAEDAYLTGNLTKSDLEILSDALTKIRSYEKPVPVPAPALPLTKETDLQLRTDYAELIGEDNPDNVEVVTYFGTYNGCEVVVMYRKDAIVTDDMSYTSLLGYTIAVGSGCYDITVHYNGSFCSLQQAYNEGYLAEEDVQAIAYYSENPIVYE